MAHKYWSQMNCPLNSSISLNNNALFINETGPPEYILPNDMKCEIYDSSLNDETKLNIMQFIQTHDQTESGNVTELSVDSFTRILATPGIIAVLKHESKIIGTMISMFFRVQYNDFKFMTSYNTFLCVDSKYREQGLAMILIRAIMKEGYNHHNINHGYYIAANYRHQIHCEIKSWYRPINIKKMVNAGFTVQTFNKNMRDTQIQQRLAYHIPKPNILPIKVTDKLYNLICKLLKKENAIYLTPTMSEYRKLCHCFDIYIVGDYGLFMLFPLTCLISGTGKRVNSAQLALMIGDILPHILWIAQENKCDLLYGHCMGDVTEERVIGSRGLVTTGKSYLELYNTKIPVPNMLVPIF